MNRHDSRGNQPAHSRALRRAAAAGLVGAAATASGLVGAGTAAATESTEPVVVDTCTGEASSSAFGQPVVAAPEALDAKVEQAALLVFPLNFELAADIREEFLSSDPVPLGTVTEQDQVFSGTDLADALEPRIADLSTAGEQAEALTFHVRNLAALGCISGADVTGHEKPAPEPEPEPAPEPTPEPTPEPEPTPQPEPAPTSEPAPEPAPEPTAQPTPPPATTPPAPMRRPETSAATSTPAEPGTNQPYEPGPAKRMVPPDYASVPGSLPPWSQTRFGTAPGPAPEIGDLRDETREQQPERTREQRVRAAGNAEAVPSGSSDRVALPVLIAAISLAAVTSALVRTWVLRRN